MSPLGHTVSVQVDDEILGKLESLAVRSRRSKSSVIRGLICMAAGDQVVELGLRRTVLHGASDTSETRDEESREDHERE